MITKLIRTEQYKGLMLLNLPRTDCSWWLKWIHFYCFIVSWILLLMISCQAGRQPLHYSRHSKSWDIWLSLNFLGSLKCSPWIYKEKKELLFKYSKPLGNVDCLPKANRKFVETWSKSHISMWTSTNWVVIFFLVLKEKGACFHWFQRAMVFHPLLVINADTMCHYSRNSKKEEKKYSHILFC